jgi:hypothetical protein
MGLDVGHDARPDAFEFFERGRHHVVAVLKISKIRRRRGNQDGEKSLAGSISHAGLNVG